jgi:hypothetical protein
MRDKWWAAAVALSVWLSGSVSAAPAPSGAAPAPAGPAVALERTLVNPNSVVVFPFERAPQPAAPPMLGEMIATRIRSGLDNSGRYTATLFYAASPLVQRARNQGAMSAEDLAGVIDPQRGVVDQDRAIRVATAMGAGSVVLGSIEQYAFNPQTNRADVTITVQFLQVPGGTPIKTVGVTSSTTATPGTPLEVVAQRAADDVAQRALTEMGVPPPSPEAMAASKATSDQEPTTEGKPSGRKRGWLAVLAILGILAVTVE